MNPNTLIYRITGAVAVVAALITLGVNCVKADVGSPADIDLFITRAKDGLSDLSPLTLRWSMKRECLMSDDDARHQFNISIIGAAQGFERKEQVETTWQDNMMYSDYRAEVPILNQSARPGASGLVPPEQVESDAQDTVPEGAPATFSFQDSHIETAIDGVNLYNVTPATNAEGSAVILITPLEDAAKRYAGAKMLHPEYFRGSGIYLPATPDEFVNVREKPIQSVVLRLLETPGVTVRQHDGTNSAILELAASSQNRVEQVECDSNKGLAVLTHSVATNEGRIIRRTRCSDFIAIEGRTLWLPRRLVVEHYSLEGREAIISSKVLLRDTYELINVSTETWPLSRFQLDGKYSEPGTFVGDRTLPEAASLPNEVVQYRVPADPGTLDEVIKRAKKGEPPAGIGLESNQWSTVRVSALLLTIALICVFAILLVRRRRKGHY